MVSVECGLFCEAAQLRQPQSLSPGVGGVSAIATVVDHFSDAVVKNPIVGQTSPSRFQVACITNTLGWLNW